MFEKVLLLLGPFSVHVIDEGFDEVTVEVLTEESLDLLGEGLGGELVLLVLFCS